MDYTQATHLPGRRLGGRTHGRDAGRRQVHRALRRLELAVHDRGVDGERIQLGTPREEGCEGRGGVTTHVRGGRQR
jgi:hypothetical protein